MYGSSAWKGTAELRTTNRQKGWCLLITIAWLLSMPAKAAELTPQDVLKILDSMIPRSAVGPSTFGIPSGFGLNSGQGYVAASITNNRQLEDERTSQPIDGSYALGVGLGDASTRVGFESNLGILSSTPGDHTEAGNLGFKVHKRTSYRSMPLGVSVGASNVSPWGDPSEIKTSFYAAVSLITVQTIIPTANPDLMITGGFSSGARNYGQDSGVFFGIGGKYSEVGSISVSWAGDELVAGTTFQPNLKYPVMVSAGIADITKANDAQRLLLAISYSFNLMDRE